MPNVLFIRQLIDTESATLSSLVLHVTRNPSIFAIHSTNAVQKEATNHTIHHDDDEDGVAAFTSDIRRVDWPAGFKPTGIKKYDGKTNPKSWLTIYGLTISAAGGDSKAMANYLPVALADYA